MEIRIGAENTDFETVHGWLTTTYWSPGVSRETVERAAKFSSMIVNAYEGDRQIGYCRIVSDRTTFGWVCDVYVAKDERGKGYARSMVTAAMDDPEHQGLRRWLLATKDAHGVYTQMGFEPLVEPARWMVRH
jgi:GNAT superfamily N-acetyltransferase